ncbi:MAG: hypothetical protein DRG24_01880, partial [Epsilonproteobacteria bacterium]
QTKQQLLAKWSKVENVTKIDYDLLKKLAAFALLIIIGILFRQYILKREHKKLQIAYGEVQKQKKKLKEQKKIYELIFDDAMDGILILDDGKFIDCNDSIVAMLKYETKEDIINRSPAQCSPLKQPDGKLSSEKVEEMIALAFKNRGHRFEWVHLNATGEEFWAEIVLTPVSIDKKEILHVVWRDISERKKLEFEIKELNRTLETKIETAVYALRRKDEILFKQSRLAQMGEMLSMIAHQWRQPLTAISATSSLIELKAKFNQLDNETAQQKANNISEYAQHLSRTIDDFRDFFKPNKEMKETSYDEVLSLVLGMIENSITNQNIKLHQDLNCHETFKTYPNELQQVILNLVKNAEDVLLEKEVKNGYIKLKTYEKNEKYILEVSDNGGGISDEIMVRIFDPYFSTKSDKNGTGLGLYMSKTIIEEHCDGELSVRNGSEGAVFRITLIKAEIGKNKYEE